MKVVKVFYSDRQSTAANSSYSPSAGKPALVVDAWRKAGLPMEIMEPRPATLTDLSRAHAPQYVRGVLAGRIVNGFGNRLPEVAQTLRWTVGSMLCAAEHAVTTGEPAWSPTSGFHHAGYFQGNAFCTFNGLMVAALALHARGLARQVAILDLDQHFGDGTREIVRYLGLDWVRHLTYGAKPLQRGEVGPWLDALPRVVTELVSSCDLVLYQAGADPHMDDPLGGAFTSSELGSRDEVVFRACRAAGVPVAVTLAGGYQKPIERVVDLHVETFRRLADVYLSMGTGGGASTTAVEASP